MIIVVSFNLSNCISDQEDAINKKQDLLTIDKLNIKVYFSGFKSKLQFGENTECECDIFRINTSMSVYDSLLKIFQLNFEEFNLDLANKIRIMILSNPSNSMSVFEFNFTTKCKHYNHKNFTDHESSVPKEYVINSKSNRIIIEANPINIENKISDILQFKDMLSDISNKQEKVNEEDDRLLIPEHHIVKTININVEDVMIGLLHDKNPKGLYLKFDWNSTEIAIKKSIQVVTRNNGFSLFIAEQTKPFWFINKSYIISNEYSYIKLKWNEYAKELIVDLSNTNNGNISENLSNNYIVLCDDYARYLIELITWHLESISCLEKFKNGKIFNRIILVDKNLNMSNENEHMQANSSNLAK